MAVTTINWPVGLPQQLLIDGYEEKPMDNLLRTSMDAAVAKQRPKFVTLAMPFKGAMIMTQAQYEQFKTFFRTTLLHGTLPFNMQKPGDTITQVVRFTGTYTPSFLGTVWRVELPLELLP